jgi:hypothetical protein
MNDFASQVGLAGIIGGCAGLIVSGTAGYFSNDTSREYERRILIGSVTGAVIAALGTTIAFANSTGAVLGALVGSMAILSHVDVYNNQNMRISNILSEALPVIAATSCIGYVLGKFLYY